MNWLTNFIRPKIQSFVEHRKDVPESLAKMPVMRRDAVPP